MACFSSHQNDTTIRIPSTVEQAGVTYYNIHIKVDDIQWKVKHRYSEFFDLHDELVTSQGISKDILPSKKVVGNKSLAFIESRRQGLEEYLEKILNFLKRTMPRVFTVFLDFHLYDIYFMLQEMSTKYFREADYILSANVEHKFTILELHAISECLKNPFPLTVNTENQLDIGPILDFCSQLKSCIINGSNEEYLQSNIIMNKLPFDFSCFKILNSVVIKHVPFENIYGLGNMKSTITEMFIQEGQVQHISQVLQCDKLHRNDLTDSEKWTSLTLLLIKNCNLTGIDETISLAKNLTCLILDDNKISCITNLTHLPNLACLSLSNNLLDTCDNLHTKLGNVASLILSLNNITTTEGFSKLYSLEELDLASNKINDIADLKYLSNLPCLKNLVLTGNTVATVVDYRIKLLELFGDRAKHIRLDNESSTQSELDKVSILRALTIVREGKTPNLIKFNS